MSDILLRLCFIYCGGQISRNIVYFGVVSKSDRCNLIPVIFFRQQLLIGFLCPSLAVCHSIYNEKRGYYLE